jgi:hypothetical protein
VPLPACGFVCVCVCVCVCDTVADDFVCVCVVTVVAALTAIDPHAAAHDIVTWYTHVRGSTTSFSVVLPSLAHVAVT